MLPSTLPLKLILGTLNKISGKHAEAIPEVVPPVRLRHSGTCQNLVKPLLQKHFVWHGVSSSALAFVKVTPGAPPLAAITIESVHLVWRLDLIHLVASPIQVGQV